MMIKLTEIVGVSVEWTTAVLFKPFKPRKWLVLTFAAFLSGSIAGGCNLNLPGGSNRSDQDKKTKIEEVSQSSSSQVQNQAKVIPGGFKGTRKEVKQFLKKYWVIIFIIVLALLALFIFFSWLSARFSFIFLENVIKNDASIKLPFKLNKELGNSLFLFLLSFAVIFNFLLGLLIVGIIYKLIKIGLFSKPEQLGVLKIFLACLPFILIAILLLIIAGIIVWICKDFVLPVMFKDRVRIRPAWAKTLAIFKNHKRDLLKYLLLTLAMRFCAGIINAIISFLGLIGLILPFGTAAAILYFISLLLPKAAHLFYAVILIIIFTPVLFFVIYCFISLYLPFSVFFRTFSLKFLSRLDRNYDLFSFNSEGGN